MTYRTREQMQNETAAARNCSILLIAEHFGYSLKQHGNYYFADGEKSLVFFTNTNSFYHYYERAGGSGIDFVMRERGCNIGDAIAYINTEISRTFIDLSSNTGYKNENYQSLRSKKELKVPEKNDNHRRVFAYLTKSRGINPDIVSEFLHKHILYEEAGKHNAVFVGYDKNMEVKHCFIRGTISDRQYRGDTYGSDKNYGFLVQSQNMDAESLIVFEAPIDLMSYKSLYPDDRSDMLALGMLSMEPIYTYLSEYGSKKIYLSLDMDAPGRQAAQEFLQKLHAEGYEAEMHPICSQIENVHVKDVNDVLCEMKQRTIGGYDQVRSKH